MDGPYMCVYTSHHIPRFGKEKATGGAFGTLTGHQMTRLVHLFASFHPHVVAFAATEVRPKAVQHLQLATRTNAVQMEWRI